MNEKDLDEQINFVSFNESKEIPTSNKKVIKIEKESIFTIVVHFPNHRAFSFKVPQNWNTKKLLSFINSTFKSEFKKSNPIFIFHGNTLSPLSESPLKEYIQPGKIHHIIITLKKGFQENQEENNQNNINFKSNKDVFKTDEFCEMEKNAIDDYIKIFQNNTLNTFPLMNPAYNHRREQMKINSTLERFAAFEPVPLEDFPIRNYFQLNIIFKCFISFFAFGIYIKGFNFVLFLSVLIGYYWYCINNVIDEFYKKKIDEIGITEEDYRTLKNGGILKIKDLSKRKSLFIFENEDDNEENKQKNKEDIVEKTNINTNFNREANLFRENIEEDLKDEEKKVQNQDKEENKFNLGKINNTNNLIYTKEEIKDLNDKNNEKTENLFNLNNRFGAENNNIRFQNNENNIKDNNINNINNIFSNNEKKEEVNENKEEEKVRQEIRPESALIIIIEIIKVFFLSLIPSLCDEFEANNPMPVNNRNHNNEDLDHNDDNNDNIDNNNNENNNINNDINNNENNDNNIRNDSMGSGNQEDDSNNNKMTSSKVVNMSEDSNRDNRIYKLIKKDNQSANENEYVFSENGGIDSLSMNSELYKQKREKEKEKEKDKEKEKQIFEEDEEYLIEEDKKKKED